jgi:hypothetical protein
MPRRSSRTRRHGVNPIRTYDTHTRTLALVWLFARVEVTYSPRGAPSLGSELLALGTFLSLSLGMECFNSNGSKEVIEEYLDQTKVQVVESERLLRKILDYLRLPTLPPLQGKL